MDGSVRSAGAAHIDRKSHRRCGEEPWRRAMRGCQAPGLLMLARVSYAAGELVVTSASSRSEAVYAHSTRSRRPVVISLLREFRF
jgi:hypothetical protein